MKHLSSSEGAVLNLLMVVLDNEVYLCDIPINSYEAVSYLRQDNMYDEVFNRKPYLLELNALDMDTRGPRLLLTHSFLKMN